MIIDGHSHVVLPTEQHNMDVRQFLEGIDCYDSDIANGGAPGLRALPQKNRYSRATESICTIK